MADLRALLEMRQAMPLSFSDDGETLLVGCDVPGTNQLHLLPARGGELRQLTDFRDPVSGQLLPDGRILLEMDESGNERTQLYLLDAQPGAEPEPLVVDPRYIHSSPHVGREGTLLAYATNRRNGVDFDVVMRTVSSADERVIWDGGGWIMAASLSPDGRYVAMQRESLLPASTQLMLADLDTGEVVPITDADQIGDWREPRWLGGAVLASSDAGAEFHSVRCYDIGANTWTIVLDADGSDREAWPSPDGSRLAVVTTDDGADRLAVYDIAGGTAGPGANGGIRAALPARGRTTTNGAGPHAATPTLRGRVEVALPHAGVINFRANEPRWSPDSSELGLTFSSPIQPSDVYLWTDGAIERRTVSNPQLATAGLIEPSSHRVPTPDDEQVPVYVYPGGRSVVLSIHGGPEAACVREWTPMHAALALAGYTVVAPNVRGSAGYGRRWVSLDDVELRLDSVADLAAVHAWLPSLGVDPGRAALYGGSYGGYMVLAGLAFQPELWAAGVEIVGISSLVTFLENTSAYRRAYREREYGSLADDRDFLEKASPLSRIGDIRAPLFVIHGANDPRVPLSEAEQIAAALRSRGLECELLVYPDEGHGLAKRANRLDAYPRAIAFLDRHLRP